MSFKLKSELTFPWPVHVMEPDPINAGQYVKQTFLAIFAILPPEKIKASQDARRKILEKLDRKHINDAGEEVPMGLDELRLIQEELRLFDENALKEIIRGWDDIVDDDGKAMKFTDVMFRELYAIERVRVGFVKAYEEAISQDRARLKN